MTALPSQQPGSPAGLTDAFARYRECITRKPFRYHTDGRQRIAETRDPSALTQLLADYRKPQLEPEYSRYTIATLLGRHFNKSESMPQLAELRADCDDPVDTWLWIQTLRNEIDSVGEANALTMAKESKSALQRAAAIWALGHASKGDVYTAIVANCVIFPKKEHERALVLGAMTSALYEQKSRVNSDEYRNAIKAYIGLLAEDVKLDHMMKVMMARHLQWILNGRALFVNPEPWLELLEHGDVKTTKDTHTTVGPRFFGIETEGERFCYVLDLSDSMCKDISPEAKPPSAPITGPRQKKPKNRKAMNLDESDLPWDRIKVRWDLAREQVRISLSRLTPDKYFCVICFGDKAELLDATKGMVKATKANILRALDELDKIEIKDEGKPANGQTYSDSAKLRGKTNMHGGLRTAFAVAGKGVELENAYVADGPLTEGADTIFLLSDGDPSWDDFDVLDKDYGEDKVVKDIERGIEAPRTPTVHYHGPYVHEPWLIADLERMNAFRNIRVHCVGLGEANEGLLKRLAETGNGDVFIVGKKK